ncbi:hypothetical protein [Algoriphagus antarcticus]|jgi:magnesium-transporting ATPase (P-type)|uniref:Uncharacterized protein n=1 Tax=Algoriphagus antarcticus TaxID=238540 RepID=A0A3E0D7B2_9BACT|nr:hypothetical protein [Algoriphagus antarcticus]REG77458.1 hypothetical protein C8N25_1464 [Algoriphagus antarcticus]
MKTKFFLLTFLLLFARGCDFYSTSLWFFDNPTGETNPLYKLFGVGWTGLIIVNIIIVGLIIYAFYYYSFKYSTPKTKSTSNTLTDFVSELYFNEKGHFLKVFYRTPKNKKILLAHSGYVFVRVVIFISFIATIHNLCQFYNISFYNSFRNLVGRPLYVIYGLMLTSVFYFSYRLWQKEFESVKTNLNLDSKSQ